MASALTLTALAQYSTGVADSGFEAADSGNGNSVANDGFTILIINNASGGNRVCTVTATAGVGNYNNATTKSVTVATTDIGILGPFPVEVFGTSLAISWDADTSTTVAAVSFQNALRTPR